MVGDADLKINGALKQTWQMKKYSYTDTVRQEHGLLYLRNGKIVYTWDNGRIEVFPGETVYLPKNSRYEAAFIGDGTAPAKDYLINFSVLGQNGEGGGNPQKIGADCGKVMALAFKETVESVLDGTEPFLMKSRFYRLLHLLTSADMEGDSRMQAYRTAAKMLAESDTLSVDEVAKTLYINRNTFQKKFKFYYGVPPAEYRCNKRIERAKQLLETTDMSAKEMAYSLGFYDVSHFYRVFTEKVGQTPKKYRENGTGNLI